MKKVELKKELMKITWFSYLSRDAKNFTVMAEKFYPKRAKIDRSKSRDLIKFKQFKYKNMCVIYYYVLKLTEMRQLSPLSHHQHRRI